MKISVKQADSFQQLRETMHSHERSHQQQANIRCCIQMHSHERNSSINELAHYGNVSLSSRLSCVLLLFSFQITFFFFQVSFFFFFFSPSGVSAVVRSWAAVQLKGLWLVETNQTWQANPSHLIWAAARRTRLEESRTGRKPLQLLHWNRFLSLASSGNTKKVSWGIYYNSSKTQTVQNKFLITARLTVSLPHHF